MIRFSRRVELHIVFCGLVLKLLKMLKALEFFNRTKWKTSTMYRSMNTMDIIKTAQGKLRGQVIEYGTGETYASFKGIPYARPPVGKLRFKAPLSPDSWKGIRDASEHGGICPQFDMSTGNILEGNEDCLYLNVYSKNLSPRRPAPVIFWVHGGAYMSGSANSDIYGPEYLLRHDVVVVTINYRLEALGFLCLDNEDVPGNAGLKDQVAALKWVKENISQFGGDPNNITLMGESAGGSSVTFLTASPMSRGLFHKVIAQSGVPTCDWSYSTAGRERAFRLGKLLGKETRDPKVLLEFLQSVPAPTLTKVTMSTMTSDERIRGLPIHYCPVVERRFTGVEPFLTEKFLDLLKKGNVDQVPFLMGYTSAEGLPVLTNTLRKKDFVNKNFYCKVPREIFECVSRSKSEEFGERINQFYLQGKGISEKMAKEVCDLESHFLFIYNSHRFADIYSKLNKNPLYMYKFSCVSDINLMKMATGRTDIEGASHADDIFYLFKNMMFTDIVDNDTRIKTMIYRMTKMWTDFAKTGNPTPDDSLGVQWLPYDAKKKATMLIADELELAQPDLRMLEFWNKIYAEAFCETSNCNL